MCSKMVVDCHMQKMSRSIKSKTMTRGYHQILNGNSFVLAAMTVLALGDLVSAVDLKCTNYDEFFYATPFTKCASYYKCYQKRSIEFKCSDNSVFDFYQQKCVRIEGTCYEPICTGKTDGKYADSTQACRRSYQCKGGALVTMDNCPQGHLFDGTKCSPQNEVNCEDPESSAVAIPYTRDDRCYGLDNGNHVVEDDYCRKYMICENDNVADVLECSFGYIFNEKSRQCSSSNPNDPSSSRCLSNSMDEIDDSCRHLRDGLHLDPTSRNCVNYIKCLNNKLVSKHDCPTLTIFNGILCVPTFLYQCPRLSPQTDLCQMKSDGFHIDPRKGCSYYIKCKSGKTVENHTCPSGFHYNPEQKLCSEKTHGDICQEAGYASDCTQRSAGYYQDLSHQSDCKQYFYCYNGKKTTFRCDKNKVFDGENCVAESTYSCPNHDPESCEFKANGYYKDNSAGCRSYYYCSNGNKISYLCGHDQAFDGGKCIEKHKAHTCNRDVDCFQKSDGYFQDLDSNCRSYYFCLRGDKAQTLTCRGSRIFDGTSCVGTDKYTCPRKSEDRNVNCIARKCEKDCVHNGFKADIDAECKSYHFCIDGKKSVLSCTGSYVFNGEICVPADTYKCPKYCEHDALCSSV